MLRAGWQPSLPCGRECCPCCCQRQRRRTSCLPWTGGRSWDRTGGRSWDRTGGRSWDRTGGRRSDRTGTPSSDQTRCPISPLCPRPDCRPSQGRRISAADSLGDMYVPPHFAVDDLETIDDFVDRVGAADLVTFDGARPVSTLLPVIWDRAEPGNGRLIGHMALNNPQWRTAAEGAHALAIVHGPQAYISP